MNEELIKKVKDVQSVEDLLALAKKENITLTDEQAKEYFIKLQSPMGELADDELDAVAGGCSGRPTEMPKFQVGDHVLKRGEVVCNLQFPFTCRSSYYVIDRITYYESRGYQYIVYCPVCNASVGLFEDEVVKL